MPFAPLPEHALYLDDRREPYVSDWEWVRTVAEIQPRLAAGVEHLSLDYDLSSSDPAHTGLDVVAWIRDHDCWPTASLQLHTGDYDGRDRMARLIVDSGLFDGPEDHPLGHIYRRRAS